MNAATSSGASYFGKLPSRGDFVRGGHQVRLIGLLDQWTSGCMEALADNPRWKLLFDSAPALDFAFVAAQSHLTVIGHLKPSRDASGRRFPFLAAASIEFPAPLPLRCGPIGFSTLWDIFRRIVGQACATDMPNIVLCELAALDCKAAVEHRLAGDPLGQFARTTTLGELAAALGPTTSIHSVRRQILAIGLLMRPLLGGRELSIEKGLCLPLPTDAGHRSTVAALWLYLIAALLRDTRCELQLLLGRVDGNERLVIGFNGASPRALLGLLAPMSLKESVIVLDDPEWIEHHPDLVTDRGVARLSSYLAQPAITVQAALTTFCEVFLGE